MRRGLALAAVALVAALSPSAALAHYGTAKLGYRSTIRGLEPPMRGLKLKVLYGDDQVWLDNLSGKTIIVDGYGTDPEPYLRFGPNGIYVNVNSPAGYLNQDRYAKTAVPKSASAKASPKWEKLAGGHVWAWHDHRIHYMNPIPPPVIKNAPRKPHHVFNWKVPLTANGKRVFITGSLDYKPPPKQSFPVTLAIVLATLVGAGIVGLFALRRVILRSLD